MSRRYNISIKKAFSHTGLVFMEGGKPKYYHQTYPHYRSDNFWLRPYTVLYKIPHNVEPVREQARKAAKEQNLYNVFSLMAFAITIWADWLVNPLRRLKVCSTAMAKLYRDILPGKWHDYDPQKLDRALTKLNFEKRIYHGKNFKLD